MTCVPVIHMIECGARSFILTLFIVCTVVNEYLKYKMYSVVKFQYILFMFPVSLDIPPHVSQAHVSLTRHTEVRPLPALTCNFLFNHGDIYFFQRFYFSPRGYPWWLYRPGEQVSQQLRAWLCCIQLQVHAGQPTAASLTLLYTAAGTGRSANNSKPESIVYSCRYRQVSQQLRPRLCRIQLQVPAGQPTCSYPDSVVYGCWYRQNNQQLQAWLCCIQHHVHAGQPTAASMTLSYTASCTCRSAAKQRFCWI